MKNTLDQRTDNNFDFMRFFAASLVVFGHSYWLSGIGHAEPVRGFTGSNDTADIAVNIFFVMSGFLIAASWINSRSAFDFAAKRALRIFPALCVSILFTVLVVGPLATRLPVSEYLLNDQTFAYLSNILLLTQFHLPGVFTDNPFADTVNGSVWTLPYEVLMYTLLLALGLLKLFGRVSVLLVALTLLLVHFLAPRFGIDSDIVHKTTRLGIFFFFGAALYLYRHHVPLNAKIALPLLGLSLWSAGTDWWMLAHALTLPYLTLYVAHLKIPSLSGFGKAGDFSYGIYIFSFPLQQLIMHWTGPEIPLSLFMVLGYSASLAMAVLSWHLIEAPALSLKKYLPKRKPQSASAVMAAPR